MGFEVNLNTQDWHLHASALTVVAPGISVWASRVTEGGKGGYGNLQKCREERTFSECLRVLPPRLFLGVGQGEVGTETQARLGTGSLGETEHEPCDFKFSSSYLKRGRHHK